ncbi:MAG: NifB/NifX family molybdenum-iron cluster-binding protein [Treponema sp.]
MEKYKVAVATSDLKTVDTHFGHAQHFLIFEVDEETGAFEDVEERDVSAACASSASCGGRVQDGDFMDLTARALEDVDYVLVAKIGPHAIRALARYDVTAYDIVLPIDEAISKINEFRRKIKARRNKKTEVKQNG